MPVREILGKTLAFGLIGVCLVGGGVAVLLGQHQYNDYLNTILGIALVLIGLGTLGAGALAIGGILYEAKRDRDEHRLHVTPRHGPPSAPPPWGMGDVGRPGSGVVQVGEGPKGGGSPRLMSVHVTNFDTPIVLGVLLVWTLVALILLAPK